LIGLSNLQLLLSSGTFILNLSYNVSGTWIEHGWLSLLWEFLTYAKLQYHASNIFWTPNKQRENDSFLMEFFLTITKNISILKAINRCRVYLQLILVSDIATADGRKLLPEVKQGSIPDWRSSLKWPHQGRPSKTDWNVWSQLFRDRESPYLTTWEMGLLHSPRVGLILSPHTKTAYKQENARWTMITPENAST
jgi:hypothetical protein